MIYILGMKVMPCAKTVEVLFVRWGGIVLIAGEPESGEVRIELLGEIFIITCKVGGW